MKRLREQIRIVLWPAFLMAGVLEMIVFAFVDPRQLHGFAGQPLDLSPMAIYTIAFFVFWAVIGLAGALTELLSTSADYLNSRGFR